MKSRRELSPILSGMLFSVFLTSTLISTNVHSEDINRAEAICTDGEVCRIAKTLVPLKVLPRPRSSIFSDKSIDSEMVVPTVPALSPLYVFARDNVDTSDSDAQVGWYQVGATETAPVGWMQAADVIEWHNALVLSYTAPGVGEEARNRVLGFESLASLSNITEADERFDNAATLIESLNSREADSPVPESVLEAGVVAAEPAGVFTDIKDNLYMWPILSWATPEDGESDERFIEFVQLVPECRGDAVSASELSGSDVAEEAAEGEEEVAEGDAAGEDEAEAEAETEEAPAEGDATAEADTTEEAEAEGDTESEEAVAEGDAEAEAEGDAETEEAAAEEDADSDADNSAEEESLSNGNPFSLPGESGGATATQKVINGADVVFVVDTTSSMTPYIEAVRAGIADLASSLAEDAGEKQIRFGFVGFQDDFEDLDYIAKDFTADGLVDAETFVAMVGDTVTTENWGDHLIPERLYEGYEAGINASWSEDSLRFMIVITDAPAIPGSDGTAESSVVIDETYVNLLNSDRAEFDRLVDVSVGDAERFGTLAQDANIVTLVNHIKPGKFADIDAVAEAQLSGLVQTEGTSEGYNSVDGSEGSIEEFKLITQANAQVISKVVGLNIEQITAELESGDIDIGAPEGEELPAAVTEAIDTTIAAVMAASMDYLGDEAIAECDYRGWTSDRDLADDAVRALEVNILLQQHQLDTLYKTLKDIYAALATSGLTGAEFIDSLQSVGTIVLTNPEAIDKAKTGTLASSGLLPVWLEQLPYQSEIANFSGEDINAMTSAERTQLELNVDQKIKYYESIIADNERWFALSEKDEDNILKQVTPLPLEELP